MKFMTLYWIAEQFIEKFFFLPVKLLSKYQFEIYKYVKKTNAPIALILDSEDHLSEEKRWPQVLKPDNVFVIIEGGHHQNFAGKDSYMKVIIPILK